MSEQYLVGVDGSAPSAAAARWAARRAGRTGAALTLLHVEVSDGARPRVDPSFVDWLAAELCAADPTLSVATASLSGPTVSGILDDAATADLLVLGTHKTGHVHGRAFGSTGIVLAGAATCSVAVVPEGESGIRRGVVLGIPVTADDSAAAMQAALLAGGEAAARGDALTVVRAVAGPGSTDEGDLVRAIRAAHPELLVCVRTILRTLAPSLLDAALGHALLVVPAPATPTASEPMLHDVLMNLTSPVLVARSATEDRGPREPEASR